MNKIVLYRKLSYVAIFLGKYTLNVFNIDDTEQASLIPRRGLKFRTIVRFPADWKLITSRSSTIALCANSKRHYVRYQRLKRARGGTRGRVINSWLQLTPVIDVTSKVCASVSAVQNERQPRNTATIRPEALVEMDQERALREAAVAVGVFG